MHRYLDSLLISSVYCQAKRFIVHRTFFFQKIVYSIYYKMDGNEPTTQRLKTITGTKSITQINNDKLIQTTQ